MNEQYLWDGQGEPDPEIQELERALSGFRYRAQVENGASRTWPSGADRAIRPTKAGLWAGIGVAASLIIGSLIAVHEYHKLTPANSGWTVSWNGSQARSVRAGQMINTGPHSTAQLSSNFVGEVRIDPDSRLQVTQTTRDAEQLALRRGTIHAFVWAPPGQFVVDTPSAKTIDLGCRYTLHVAPDGSGVLQVETGWVAFQWKHLESFIPEGAECRTRPSQGPGTPHYDDAPAALTAALSQFDETQSPVALRAVLSSARSRDALTIWHLLMRTQGPNRLDVFRRLRELVALPAAVTQESILRGDPSAIDACWNALGVGNTDWWREWKRRW
jgi:hypothetical protein